MKEVYKESARKELSPLKKHPRLGESVWEIPSRGRVGLHLEPLLKMGTRNFPPGQHNRNVDERFDPKGSDSDFHC